MCMCGLQAAHSKCRRLLDCCYFVLCLSTKTFKNLQYLAGSQDQSLILEEFRTNLQFTKSSCYLPQAMSWRAGVWKEAQSSATKSSLDCIDVEQVLATGAGHGFSRLDLVRRLLLHRMGRGQSIDEICINIYIYIYICIYLYIYIYR